MAVADRILKNFNLFVDGRGYAGNIDTVKLPDFMLQTEEYRAGGMDVPIDIEMGQEKMESTFTTSKIDSDLLKQVGLQSGEQTGVTLRGALEDNDGTVVAVVVTMRGKVLGVENAEIQAGQKSTISFKFNPHYFKYVIDDETIYEIDIINMVRFVGGVDQLKSKRDALAI